MGTRSLTLLVPLLATAACGPGAKPAEAPHAPPPGPVAYQPPTPPPRPDTLPEKVVYDFEMAIKTSRDAYVDLFNFTAVGEMEILLHRYDLLGRLEHLPDDIKAQFAGEGAVPYPAEREKKNVGGFYKILGQRTVGSGGCTAQMPRTEYGKLLATFDPLPANTAVDYEPLRQKAMGYVKNGGLIALRCSGGKGGVALVYTQSSSPRGYDLITIYDD